MKPPLSLKIPDHELDFTFSRSSGPGGQNVNKVNSKVHLRWNVLGSKILTEEVRQRLLSKLGPQLTSDGDLLVSSDRHRDQLKNRHDCVEKLSRIVAAALVIPRKRKKTKPSRSSVRKSKEKKRLHSQKKSQRGRVRF